MDFKGGRVEVYAADNAVRSSESVDIKGGSLYLEAGNDALKTSSAKKPGKGYVEMTGGELFILAGGDGISAESEITLFAGEAQIHCTGLNADKSSQALKAKTEIRIKGAELFALQNRAPEDLNFYGSHGYILEALSGKAGDIISLPSGREYEAINEFKALIYSYPELSSGQEYEIYKGTELFNYKAA